MSPGSLLPYFTTQRRMPIEEFLLVSGPKSSLAEKKQHPNTEISPETLPAPVSPCGCSPDSPYGTDRNFFGTYPPNIRGCSPNLALWESPQKVVFDEVTMTKFSLALLAGQKHPQMRCYQLPVKQLDHDCSSEGASQIRS